MWIARKSSNREGYVGYARSNVDMLNKKYTQWQAQISVPHQLYNFARNALSQNQRSKTPTKIKALDLEVFWTLLQVPSTSNALTESEKEREIDNNCQGFWGVVRWVDQGIDVQKFHY